MSRSDDIEQSLTMVLRRAFPDVVNQWNTSKGASDAFQRDRTLYAPRPDIGVGPFSLTNGNRYREMVREFASNAPAGLQQLVSDLQQNQNPRCLLSIEISCSGSTKHILGDITNASLMGLYGLVVVDRGSEADGKAKRVLSFLKKAKEVKLPYGPNPLFENVIVVDFQDLLDAL